MTQEQYPDASNLVDQAVRRLHDIIALGASDLHIHTTHSDGFENSGTVVENAIRNGLASFAITDQDTTQAVMDIHRILHKLDLVQMKRPVFVPGVEVSADYKGRELHILAYFPLGGEYRLEPFLKKQQQSRELRNRLMCEKLAEQGCPLRYEALKAIGGTLVGRMHMATLLVRDGYYLNTNICFDAMLADGRPAYVKRDLEDVSAVLELIRSAGGVPVLAHPFKYAWNQGRMSCLQSEIKVLKEMGLEGLETVHGEATEDEMSEIAALARELKLLKTSGSDLHVTYGSIMDILRSEVNHQRFLD